MVEHPEGPQEQRADHRFVPAVPGWVVSLLGLLVAASLGTFTFLGAPSMPPGSPPGPKPVDSCARSDAVAAGARRSVFDDADRAMCQMVEADVSWRHPRELTVNEPAQIGLVIGDGEPFLSAVQGALPGTQTTPAGQLRIGTDVSATLHVADTDGVVVPTEKIRASTGSRIGLAWTWSLRPLRPADSITVIAHVGMDVPGTEHTLSRNLSLKLPVRRTLSYTANQVATSWQTYAVVVGGVAAGLRMGLPWLRRRKAASGPGSGAVKLAAAGKPKTKAKRKAKQTKADRKAGTPNGD